MITLIPCLRQKSRKKHTLVGRTSPLSPYKRVPPPPPRLFHQGQFPYCSGDEARRVQHFPDFNLETIFITKNIFIMKNPTDFGKTVENGLDPCLPNSRAQFSSS